MSCGCCLSSCSGERWSSGFWTNLALKWSRVQVIKDEVKIIIFCLIANAWFCSVLGAFFSYSHVCIVSCFCQCCRNIDGKHLLMYMAMQFDKSMLTTGIQYKYVVKCGAKKSEKHKFLWEYIPSKHEGYTNRSLQIPADKLSKQTGMYCLCQPFLCWRSREDYGYCSIGIVA